MVAPTTPSRRKYLPDGQKHPELYAVLSCTLWRSCRVSSSIFNPRCAARTARRERRGIPRSSRIVLILESVERGIVEIREELRLGLESCSRQLREKTYDRMARVGNFAELCGVFEEHKVFSIAYNGKEQRPRAEDFDLFCRAAYACTSIAVAVDEIDLHINSQWMRRAWKLVSLGRTGHLPLLRHETAKEIHPLIRSQPIRSSATSRPSRPISNGAGRDGRQGEGLRPWPHEAIVLNDTST